MRNTIILPASQPPVKMPSFGRAFARQNPPLNSHAYIHLLAVRLLAFWTDQNHTFLVLKIRTALGNS